MLAIGRLTLIVIGFIVARTQPDCKPYYKNDGKCEDDIFENRFSHNSTLSRFTPSGFCAYIISHFQKIVNIFN